MKSRRSSAGDFSDRDSQRPPKRWPSWYGSGEVFCEQLLHLSHQAIGLGSSQPTLD